MPLRGRQAQGAAALRRAAGTDVSIRNQWTRHPSGRSRVGFVFLAGAGPTGAAAPAFIGRQPGERIPARWPARAALVMRGGESVAKSKADAVPATVSDAGHDERAKKIYRRTIWSIHLPNI
jgi:hypothetical protein